MWGLKLIFLIVTRAVSLLGLSRREWWREGRRDTYAAPSARRGPARAAWRSFAFDVGGPAGLALLAGTVPAERGGDAVDRHSRHDLAVAARYRLPLVGAPVAQGPLWAPDRDAIFTAAFDAVFQTACVKGRPQRHSGRPG